MSRGTAVGLGLAFGLYFVFTSPYRHAPLWAVWAPLVVAFTTTSGVVFGYGLNRWAELVERHTALRLRSVANRVAAVAAISLSVLLSSTLVLESAGVSWRHVALISTLLLGGVPAVLDIEGIRHVAVEGSTPVARGARVAEVIRLRRLLLRLLAAVGSLVTLSTLATGASATLEQTLSADAGPGAAAGLPPQFVLVFGGLGSLLVALFYVPAAAALQRQGLRLCEELFPLDDADEPAAILDRAEDRHKLEQLLGTDRGAVADLQTGLAIFGPLLASAAGAFLSP